MLSTRVLCALFAFLTIINGISATTTTVPTTEPTSAPDDTTTTAEPTTTIESNATDNATDTPVSSTTTSDATESTTEAGQTTAPDSPVVTTTPACAPLTPPRAIFGFPRYFQVCLNGEWVTRRCYPGTLFTEIFGSCVPRGFYQMLQRWLRRFALGNQGKNMSGESMYDD